VGGQRRDAGRSPITLTLPLKGGGNSCAVAIDVTVGSPRWRRSLPDAERRAARAARAALRGAASRLRARRAELSLVLADDGTVRRLNRRWRGRDRATNVLSFPAAEPPPRGAPLLLGDVVLAFETVRREAKAQGKSLADHLAHLVTHGVLHLIGYDHAADAEARRMEGLERRILRRLGIADPYGARAR
jgi:probable rRNA maturation factor